MGAGCSRVCMQFVQAVQESAGNSPRLFQSLQAECAGSGCRLFQNVQAFPDCADRACRLFQSVQAADQYSEQNSKTFCNRFDECAGS